MREHERDGVIYYPVARFLLPLKVELYGAASSGMGRGLRGRGLARGVPQGVRHGYPLGLPGGRGMTTTDAVSGLLVMIGVVIGWWIARQRPVGTADIMVLGVLVAGVVGALAVGAVS